jgi:hypothetical protein
MSAKIEYQFLSDKVKRALLSASAQLAKAAKNGEDQIASLQQFVADLNASQVYLAEVTKAGTLKPDNKLSVQADAAQSSWDPEGPYIDRGTMGPLGCGAQVARARYGVNLTQLAASENSFTVPESFLQYPDYSSEGCECRITEQGCIDPSLCLTIHGKAPLPTLTRWTFSSAIIIKGGCYLLAWSGWAHPAVMSLLHRYPKNRRIKDLIKKTNARNLHLNEKVLVHVTKTYDDGTKLYHLEYLDKNRRKTTSGAVSIKVALDMIGDDDRVGGYDEEGETSSAGGKSFPVPTSFKPTPPVEALGGLSIVPTFLPALQRSSKFDQFWTPTTFPTDATDITTLWQTNANNTDINVHRRSEYTYHYPEELANPLIGERFTDQLMARWAYRAIRGGANMRPYTIPTQYTRSFRARPPIRVALPEFTAITDLLNGAIDYDTLKTADNVGSFSRALGARANRLQQGWEAEIVARWLRVRDFAKSGAQSRQFFEFAYRMVTRYIGAQAVNDLNASVPNCSFAVADSATQIELVYINAATPLPAPGAPGAPPAPVANGEQPMWEYPSLQSLMTGRAQFLDVEGLSREEIAQALACLVPTTFANVPSISQEYVDDHDADQQRHWALHILRNTFPNGVVTVYLHFGNNPLPDGVTQNWIQAHANDVPDHAIISTLIRHFASRHDLNSVLEDAIQTALYRTVGYKNIDARGSDPAKADNTIIDADGNQDLFLPKNNTRWGYFDVFYQPVALSPLVESLLAFAPREIVNIGSLLPTFKAVSLNWTSKALTMLGDEWAIPAAGGNQYLRNHWDKLVRHFYSSTVTLWSTLHANTLAFQFGFTQPPICRSTENGAVYDWWASYQAPYLVNHYLELWGMETMPMFQALPYYDAESHTSCVQWPSDTPRPVQNWLAFDQSRQVKVAREHDPIPGYSWLGDGGAEYNLQFYIAQGNDGQWVKDGGLHKGQISWWPGERIDQPPAAPVPIPVATHQYMGAVNTPFADFLLPGSVRSYDTDRLRIRNWAVQQQRDRPLTGRESHRWWEAANQLPHRSLMVNYIHPFRERREIDAIADYSVVFWEQDNAFAGLTYSNLFTEISKGDARFDTIRPQQTMFALHADSKPRESEFYNPMRVSSSRAIKPNGKLASHGSRSLEAKENPNCTPLSLRKVGSEIKARIAALARGHSDVGTISYETKYPHQKADLPPMEHSVVEYDESAIRALPDEPIDKATMLKLAAIDNNAIELDNAFQQFLQEQKARVMASRPMPVVTTTGHRGGYSSPRVSSPRPRRAVMTGGLGTSKLINSNEHGYRPAGQQTQFTPRQVSFNDAAASSAQSQAVNLQRILDMQKTGYSPARNISGVRYPHSRSVNQKLDQPNASVVPSNTTDKPSDTHPLDSAATGDDSSDQVLEYPGLEPPKITFKASDVSADGSFNQQTANTIHSIINDGGTSNEPDVMSLTTPKN